MKTSIVLAGTIALVALAGCDVQNERYGRRHGLEGDFWDGTRQENTETPHVGTAPLAETS